MQALSRGVRHSTALRTARCARSIGVQDGILASQTLEKAHCSECCKDFLAWSTKNELKPGATQSGGDLRIALPQKLPARKVVAVAAQVAVLREVTALHQQIVAYTDGQTDLSNPSAVARQVLKMSTDRAVLQSPVMQALVNEMQWMLESYTQHLLKPDDNIRDACPTHSAAIL